MGVGRYSPFQQAQGVWVVWPCPQSPFSWVVSWSGKGTDLGYGEGPMAVSECHSYLMVTVHLARHGLMQDRHLALPCPPSWNFQTVTEEDTRVLMEGRSSPEDLTQSLVQLDWGGGLGGPLQRGKDQNLCAGCGGERGELLGGSWALGCVGLGCS